MHIIDQALRNIAGRGTNHIGQHQHRSRTQWLQQGPRGRQGLLRRLVGGHVQHQQVSRAIRKHMHGAFAQRAGQGGVGDDEKTGMHGVRLCHALSPCPCHASGLRRGGPATGYETAGRQTKAG